MENEKLKNISAENHEISDTDAESIAAGGRKSSDGRRIVTVGMICVDMHNFWICKDCFGNEKTCYCKKTLTGFELDAGATIRTNTVGVCGSCAWCSYEGGTWHCENPQANAR